MPDIKDRISQIIKDKAAQLGFDACGISEAGLLREESIMFRDWLSNGLHATMSYMAKNVDKRLDPTLLNEWARSVIIVTYNYFPENQALSEGNFKISKYAFGRDYHDVIREKLKELVESIEDEIGAILARVFVDSAPVMEKAWAVRAGLGWIGKNACLINRRKGSFFFLGSIITNLDLAYDRAEENEYCGNCTTCMDSCPNRAIVSPGVIDAGKCISYMSIEHKEDFEAKQDKLLHNWIFGCDICQDVCPWNKFSKPHHENEFLPNEELINMCEEDWNELDRAKFNELFSGTAVERTGYSRLRRNIEQSMREQRNKE